MFEAAELGVSVDKAAFKKEAAALREALLNVQKRFASANFSTVVIVSGVEGAGKPETVNLLLQWMDARGIQTHAMWDPTDDERERPPSWRFWRLLPPTGRMGIFFGSWYTAPIINCVLGEIDDAKLDQELDGIVRFEEMLAKERVQLVKFWMHLSKSVQKKRLKALEADKLTRWRVTDMDWKFFKKYDRFRAISEHALRRTSTALAPWHIVEAADERHRSLTVARTLLKTLEQRLAAEQATPKLPRPKPSLPRPEPVNIIRSLDMSVTLDKDAYEKKLLKYSGMLNLMSRKLYQKRRSLIAVFEGPDAAGKGGAIRRLTSAVDARMFQVMSVAAPTDEERARPYLWRFWRNLPRMGRVTIYDRSWYGRVLVERVEDFCAEGDWQRAYAEINSFEEQISSFGTAIVKFWMAVSPKEQLRRFKDRKTTSYKQYKLTEEDWRNREKWDAYEAAACDMIAKTSTDVAPWTFVEADNKYWARIKVLKTVCKRVERALDA